MDTPAAQKAVTLKLPDGVDASLYARVRADPVLGKALDDEMIPALQAPGSPSDRVAKFLDARSKALKGFKGTLTPEEAASKATGPMSSPGLTAFDKVSTDVLRAYYITTAEAVAAGAGERAVDTLTNLEASAKRSFPWEAGAGDSVAVRIMLVRAGLEQRKAAP